MATTYDVTVGIPVYNVEHYIRKCLLSILDQTFDGNLEILVVNDCCTDNTMEIIRELQETHPKGQQIFCHTQSENLGIGMSRNLIIEKAQGKYLLFVDSDDYITPDCIQKLYAEAEKNQAEVVYGSVKTINTNVELSYLSQPYKVFNKPDELASYAFQNLHENLRNYIWNNEDVIFSTDMVPLVTKAILLPDVTYYYVIRDNSLSNLQGRTTINLQEIMEFIDIYTYVKNKNQSLKGKPYYEARCARSMTQMLYIVSGLIKNRKIITPALTNKTIKDAMKHPASLLEIMTFKRYKMANLAFYVLGVLPGWLTVFIITVIAKYKHLL